MAIIIKDLEINIELDREAMKSLLGGRGNPATRTTSSNLSSSRRMRHSKSGLFMKQKRRGKWHN